MRRAGLALVLVASCGGSTTVINAHGDAGPDGQSGAGSGGIAGASGGTGASGATGGAGGNGALPNCMPASPDCYVNGPGGPGAECLALHDNVDGAPTQLRVSQLVITSPVVLAQPFMQDALITKKTGLDRPDCFQFGDGQLNLLIELDAAAGTARLGAALPLALIGDPKTDGACWATFDDPGSGYTVAPAQTAYAAGGQSFDLPFDRFALPMFLENKLDSYVLFPLQHVQLTGTLSADRDCIGAYDAASLDPDSTCSPGAGSFAWTNGGELRAHILVSDSDRVEVTSLGYTLCVLVSGDVAKWKGPKNAHGIATCQDSDGWTQSGGQLPDGDWCASTDAPATATCHDAFRFDSSYAASGIAINGTCP